MIGYRGCYRYVKEPELFTLELDVLARVRAETPNVHVMIPFVRTKWELEACLELVDRHALGRDRKLLRWVMAEVPSVVYRIPDYAKLGIHGVSIGSNDLTQLVLGVDRDSETCAELFDEADEAVLDAIARHHPRGARARHDLVAVRPGSEQPAGVRRAPGALRHHVDLGQPRHGAGGATGDRRSREATAAATLPIPGAQPCPRQFARVCCARPLHTEAWPPQPASSSSTTTRRTARWRRRRSRTRATGRAAPSSGEEGIRAFETEQPDCVLLDVRMPGIDGFAVCARIRALPGGAETPIVFLTALRDVDTFDRALRAGGDDFLTKPVRPTELVVRVQAALELRRMSAELREHYELVRKQRDDLMRLQLQKERLTAFVVHDLKNPVNSMDLHAQVLLRDPELPASARESVQHIRERRALARCG